MTKDNLVIIIRPEAARAAKCELSLDLWSGRRSFIEYMCTCTANPEDGEEECSGEVGTHVCWALCCCVMALW